MTYEQARLAAIREAYLSQIKLLAARYKPGARTLVLLPGGMGSELLRSPKKFSGTSMPLIDYQEVWIDLGIMLGDGPKLEIADDGSDLGNRIVVPAGPFSFVINPYEDTRRWADQRGDNYVVFGFDWRRSLGECAAHLNQFLLDFQAAITTKFGGVDPLPTTCLLCHSQGGLVAKLFMTQYAAQARNLERVITVATPFYGTTTHMRRYFMGEDLLNSSSANGGARNVARIIATLPGPYTLMPLDLATFRRDGAALGLSDYPVRDQHGEARDPYDSSNIGRYPTWISRAHLASAIAELAMVRQPLPAALAAKLFHIRAIKDTSKTELEWRPLPADFDPETAPSPLRLKGTAHGGDGTVPAWSAFLPSTPGSNCVTLPGAKEHLSLMEHPEALAVIDRLLPPTAPAPKVGPKARIAPRRAIKAPRKPQISKAQLHRFEAAVATLDTRKMDQESFVKAIARRRAAGVPHPLDARLWRAAARTLIG